MAIRLLVNTCLIGSLWLISLPNAKTVEPVDQRRARTLQTDAERKPAPPPARPTVKSKGEISFDDLKFDILPDAPYDSSMLTDEIRALDGKVVKLRGFILPSTLFRETDISEFVLVRDNQECCFGPGAALFDCVVVNLVGDTRTDFTTRPVTVTGTFKLKEYKYPDDSGHFAIFNMQGTSVK
jgi:hypothetical protein